MPNSQPEKNNWNIRCIYCGRSIRPPYPTDQQCPSCRKPLDIDGYVKFWEDVEQESEEDSKNRTGTRKGNIPGTRYQIQYGRVNGKPAFRLLKDDTIVDMYIYKEEELNESGFLDESSIADWVLRTVALPNINPHQVMKMVQAMTIPIKVKWES